MLIFPKAFKTYIPRSHCISSHVYGAIVINQCLNEVIVIKGRISGKWSFPKGHGKSWETPLIACIRELKEETGLDFNKVIPDDEIRFGSGTYFVFLVKERLELIPEDIKEVVEAKWIHVNGIPLTTANKDLTSFCRYNIAQRLIPIT